MTACAPISETAERMLRLHGEEAHERAAIRAQRLLRENDFAGFGLWLEIAAIIRERQSGARSSEPDHSGAERTEIGFGEAIFRHPPG